MKKLLPILLIVLGLGGGAGAGLMLRPAPPEVVIDPCGDMPAVDHADAEQPAPAPQEPEEEDASREYVKMQNQFIVPVVTSDRVAALVVLALSLEVDPGQTEFVFSREPKLRDVFLQTLFDHANMGGFDGNFTNSNNLDTLRSSLFNVARRIVGPVVTDVLITDIARQDS